MIIKGKNLCCFSLIWMLSGCAGHQSSLQNSAKPDLSAPFSAGAISVTLNARPDLNLVNGMANSCTIIVLQAAKAETLEQILINPVKVKSLFAGAGVGTDAANGHAVLQIDRYTMMPGQTTTLHVDRAMHTRYMALIAGYYPFPGKQHQIQEDIPVRKYKTGWLNPVWHRELSPLSLAITLGSEGIISTQKNVQKSQAPDVSLPDIDLTETKNSGADKQ
ncbi:type VI secretion lipoprotein TssJ [Pantoea eucalypti]|uniref:type VI secretion lipoprotein TssJ n=1 Tax=Pantoea eucalypti TaxID=470933 RepID=UPI003FA4A4CE